MQLAGAIVCEATTSRDGLINILSGGITRIERPQYPSVLGLQLAILIVPEDEEYELFNLSVSFGDDSGNEFGTMKFSGEPIPPDKRTPPTEDLGIVTIAVPLNFFLPEKGRYWISIALGDEAPIRWPIFADKVTPTEPGNITRKTTTPGAKRPAKKKAAAKSSGTGRVTPRKRT